MKVPEIKKKLNELGIEFDDTLTKPDLLDLLEKHSKEESNSQDETPEENHEDNQENTENNSEEIIEPKRYVVIHDFKDLKDGNIIYIKGDIYPRRADSVIDEARVQELMSSENKIGKPLIKEQD